MATITVTKGYNDPTGWISGEEVTPAKLNQAQTPSLSISNIVNDDISASAGIEGSKLSSSAQASLVPAGAVMAFAMNTAPSGWLAANGNAVSRSTYAALFSAIGTTHGVGDGSTTFNLPDLRGIFVRGSDSQTISGTTHSGTFGAKLTDSYRQHQHFVAADVTLNANTPLLTSTNYIVDDGQNPAATTLGYIFKGTNTAASVGLTSESGGTETYPANIALLYCIKF